MKLEDLHKLALKYPNYQDFLKQIYKLHRYTSEVTIKRMEDHINAALGNKIPDSAFEDRFHVERKQM